MKGVFPLLSLGMAVMRDFRGKGRGITGNDPELKAEIRRALVKLQSIEEKDADTVRQIAGLAEQLKAVSACLDGLSEKAVIAVWIAAAALVTALIAMLFAIFR